MTLKIDKPIRQQGLHPSVKESFKECLKEALPIWEALEPQDLYKVLKSISPTSYQINLAKRKGIRTSREFITALQNTPSFIKLQKSLNDNQPEISRGFIVKNMGFAISLHEIISQVAKSLDRQKNGTLEDWGSTLEEIDQILKTREAEIVLLSPVEGLMAPELTRSLNLGQNVFLRPLSDEEIESIFSHDVLSMHYPVAGSIDLPRFALEIKFKSPISFDDTWDSANDPVQAARIALTEAHRALNIFKSGGAQISFTKIRYAHYALPNASTYTTMPTTKFPARYTLGVDEFCSLEEMSLLLKAATYPGLEVACDRLHDAELRINPRDALVDACIGLEALLLSAESKTEISYRMAMNFSTLQQPSTKKDAYRKMRDIYSARSKIVHGAKLSQEYKINGKTCSVHEVATIAKESLREAINVFLKDQTLSKESNIDWERRYFS